MTPRSISKQVGKRHALQRPTLKCQDRPFPPGPRRRLTSLLVTAACCDARHYRHQTRVEQGNGASTTFSSSNYCINSDSCNRALCPLHELLQTTVADRMPGPYQRREPTDN